MPDSIAMPLRPPRILAPKDGGLAKKAGQTESKRRQPKSRCLTCRAKRVKCDEVKPECRQCTGRGIVCGGYQKDLQWKAYGQPKRFVTDRSSGLGMYGVSIVMDTPLTRIATRSRDHKGSGAANLLENARSQGLGDGVQQDEPNCFVVSAFTSTRASPESRPNVGDAEQRGRIDTSVSNRPRMSWHCSGDEIAGNGQFPMSDHNGDLRHDSLADSTFPSFSFPNLEDWTADNDDYDWDACEWTALEGMLTRPALDYPLLEDETMQVPELDMSLHSWLHSPMSPVTDLDLDLPGLFQQPQFKSGSAEMICLVFNQYTCHLLSIDDQPHLNPWRTDIWPLSKEHPALYHGLAAMTCFHLSKARPDLRTHGFYHVDRSMSQMSATYSEDANVMPLEVVVATLLALGWAETWDSQLSSTGKMHIANAGGLIRGMRDYSNQSALLRFLTNNFLYMDTIARLTSTFDDMTIKETPILEIPSASSMAELQFDNLMGYASTLFPVLRGIADLVGCIRYRDQKRNSAAMVSRATELKTAVERWKPSVDPDTVDELTATMSDAVQTAEAYRWASLLLLQQAVPELPNTTSYGRIAQTILVFLATVPLTSTTLKVHHFPLMMAGTETVEREDRDWVRERWHAMGQRMITGIVDKCLDVTTEVWRRRDEYAERWRTCPISGAKQPPRAPATCAGAPQQQQRQQQQDGRKAFFDTSSFEAVAGVAKEGYERGAMRNGRRSTSPTFPLSAAFSKGVDQLTRSGCLDFTVRGTLHWLGVMKDFGWEVMLG
ncbi:hypothetical protein EJ05DRAFT_503988 [Pseudovirgaria hyperparasitica]|uniref:Zn(2)-C6 fungal-type domain-containing protein n=1 Tax=Pseudovirgaria hyperparasitica TaxID=470096 RepID=A0A6A6VYR0_9PEZI|nr:uncharacterized protein EJ05DRAFT_503988 [Pseudovirgaria hyperparasitica]KAF2754447.1 hypothetical protein EJ05DRAFT_503988 [Pseudovirgaria hyperparasitica]